MPDLRQKNLAGEVEGVSPPQCLYDLPEEWYRYAAQYQVRWDHIYVVRCEEEWQRLCEGRQAPAPESTRGLAWRGSGGERHLALFWARGPFLPVEAVLKYFLHELGHHVLGHLESHSPSDRFWESAEREAEMWAFMQHRDWILPYFAYVASYDISHDRSAYRGPWKKFIRSLSIEEATFCLRQVDALAQEVREYIQLWKALQREATAAIKPFPELEGGLYTQHQSYLLEKWIRPFLCEWLSRSPYRRATIPPSSGLDMPP